MNFGARGGELHALPCVGAVRECARMRCCEMGDHGPARLRRPVNNQKRHVAGAGNITVKPGGARLVTVASTIRDGDVECRAGCRGTCRGEDGVKQTCSPCRIAHHIGLGLQCVKIVRHKDKSAVGRLRIQRDKRLTETALFTCARERMGREHDLRRAADKASGISVADGVGCNETDPRPSDALVARKSPKKFAIGDGGGLEARQTEAGCRRLKRAAGRCDVAPCRERPVGGSLVVPPV